MIKSFKCKETEKIFYRFYSAKLPVNIQRLAQRKLYMLDSAPDFNSLRMPPGNRLEALSGNRKGKYSIRINDQWRICFDWKDNDSFNVEIIDYH